MRIRTSGLGAAGLDVARSAVAAVSACMWIGLAAGDAGAALTNVAYHSAATQMNTLDTPYGADKAVDGNESTFQHTSSSLGEWWRTDLGAEYLIDSIKVVPGATPAWVDGSVLTVYGVLDDLPVWSQIVSDGTSNVTYTLPANTYGRYVQIKFPWSAGNKYLSYKEIYVYSDGTTTAQYNNETNLARTGFATMSSAVDPGPAYAATNAIDGLTDSGNVAFTSTSTNGNGTFWQVDLGCLVKRINCIHAWNGGYDDYSRARFSGLNVQVFGRDGETAVYDYYLSHTNTYWNSGNVLGSPQEMVLDLTGLAITGQTVRVTRKDSTNNDYYLELYEVQVFGEKVPGTRDTTTNLALAGAATQSSTILAAGYANNGELYGAGNAYALTGGGAADWWQVDLGSVNDISIIRLWNFLIDSAQRFSDLNVQVIGNDGSTVVYDYYLSHGNTYLNPANVENSPQTLQAILSGLGVRGRIVKVSKHGSIGGGYLALAEVQVLGTPLPPSGTIIKIR